MSRFRSMTLTKAALVRSAIPEAFWTLGPDTWQCSRAELDDMRRLARDFSVRVRLRHRGVCFIGQSGTFKTFRMTMLMKTAMQAENQAFYITADTLDSLLFSREADQKAELEALRIFPGVLGIDNLNEHQNPTLCNKLGQFLDSRCDNKYPTIVCIGCGIDELNENFKDSFIDKIHSKMEIVTC